MMNNPARLPKSESAEAGNFGTNVDQNYLANTDDPTEGILTHSAKGRFDFLDQRACQCGAKNTPLYLRKGKMEPVCSECLFSKKVTRRALNSAKIEANIIVRKHKQVLLFRCFGCERSLAGNRMSSCLICCKACLASFRSRPQRFGQDLDRVLLKVAAFLRRHA